MDIESFISLSLQEDIGSGDHTSLATIPAEAKGKARLLVKDEGIIAGVEIAIKIFHKVDPSLLVTVLIQDGSKVKFGDIVLTIEGSDRSILTAERLVLNCMQRMSGIASLTKTYSDKLKGYKTKILDTRKTTPNFRLLEKEAVKIGGAYNHRFGLYDMIMLKDNHIDYCGGITQAIEKAFQYVQTTKTGLKIEVETRTIEDVEKVLKVGKGKVFRVMFDNFTPQQIIDALKIIDGAFETEASGGINLDNIQAYAATGVDYVSVGALIHQAKSLDLSLKATID